MDRQYWAPRDEDYEGEWEDIRAKETKAFFQNAAILLGALALFVGLMLLIG